MANPDPITDQERVERHTRVARALESIHLEGFAPTEKAQAVFNRYVAGDMTTKEMILEIRALSVREFKPAHPPED